MKTVIAGAIIFISAVALFPNPSDTFKGKIISIEKNVIEVKSGSREILLSWTDKTVITFKGMEVLGDSLDLCQTVSAHYEKINNANELIKLEILQEGYCAR